MTTTVPDPAAARRLLDGLLPLVARAAARILEVYAGDFTHRTKADRSPVTAADELAEAVIVEGLAALTPDWPVVAEEAVARGTVPRVGDGPFWLVDPLDGTREFVARRGEFTVNVGLVVDGRSVLGVVAAPALATTWYGAAALGAFRQDGEGRRPIRVRRADPDRLVAVASRSHRDPETDAWLVRHGIRETVAAGSSLKFCVIAEGRADVYPRFGRTMEWDTAAGQAVLEAAGGRVLTVDGAPLRYGKPGFVNPGFVAWGGLEPRPDRA